MFCKYILGLKRSTPNYIAYRELGRYPVDTKIKTSIIAYWSRVVNDQNQKKLTSLLYKTLYHLYTTGVFRSTWMETIETVLNECGMSNVWQTQCQGISSRWLKEAVKARLQDQFAQRTDNLINVNSKCFLYKDIKQDHKFEDYLVNLPRCFYVPILKLRSCNHRLPVERGRYSNIPRERRYCDLCNENIIGDEYHFVLECKHGSMVQYRNQYLPKFYRHRPSMLKFVTLMKNATENHKLAIKFGSF